MITNNHTKVVDDLDIISERLTPVRYGDKAIFITVRSAVYNPRLLCETNPNDQHWDTGETGWLGIASNREPGAWSYAKVHVTGRKARWDHGSWKIACQLEFHNDDARVPAWINIRGGGFMDIDSMKAVIGDASSRARG